MRYLISIVTALALGASLLGSAFAGSSANGQPASTTVTPVQHLVVIFDENVSFDHYFGTYPYALNPASEPKFTASPGTPSVNGLDQALLTHNPNSANPVRLDRSQALPRSFDR